VLCLLEVELLLSRKWARLKNVIYIALKPPLLGNSGQSVRQAQNPGLAAARLDNERLTDLNSSRLSWTRLVKLDEAWQATRSHVPCPFGFILATIKYNLR
jgi:hypothetical protein